MSMIKKLLALTLALAMVLSVSAFAGYKADTYADADQINGDCKDAIELLYVLDIMKGDGKNFNPEASVTRSEMAKMIYVILNYGNDDKAVTYTGAKMFSDVPAGAWYEGYVNYCAATKLVQGRPDGTFGPMDPVSTAEAAKMLLTAIGYSAEARGYTGANWDKNVLSDAAIIGLLDGYKSNVNTFAPRQWVAVMMENALSAKTYKTMVPNFSGLLTSGDQDGVTTMGDKYYGINIYEGYIVAANGYSIDGMYTVEEEDEEGNEVEVDKYLAPKSGRFYIYDTDLEENVLLKGAVDINDLGQHFKVITVDGSVVSIRNTGKSVVVEDEVKDVEYELTYSTSSENKHKNRYEFTVDSMTAKIDTDSNVAKVLDVKDGNKTYTVENANGLKAAIDWGKNRNDVVRAIDKNGDGDFDYIIYTPVNYGRVEKVGESQKYGEYVKIVDVDNKTFLTYNDGSNLYLDSVILCEEDLVVDNFVKYTWNPDEGMYNVEVLPVEEAVEFEARKSSKNLYTFGGEAYTLAANAFEGVETKLEGTNVLEEDFDIVVDGDLLVYAALTDDNYNSIDEVNEQLALLIKHNVGNLDRENVEQVKLMTIDGEIEWYWFDKSRADDKSWLVDWADLTNDTLYIYHTDEDGFVTLEAIEEEQAGEGNLKTKLVDTFNYDYTGDLDNTGSRTLYKTEEKDYRVASSNKFFAKVDDEYMIITMDELEEGKYETVAAQAMVKNSTYYSSIVGGYLDIDEAVVSGIGYLWIVDADVKEVDDETKIISVMFPDTEEAVEIEVNVAASVQLHNDWAYAYTQGDDVYTLSFMPDRKVVVEEDGELWNVDSENVELDHDLYLITYKTDYRIVSDLTTEERTEWKTFFCTAEDIMAAFDEMDEDTYDYVMDYVSDENADDTTIFYMVVERDMIENQTGEIEIDD